MDWLKFLEQHKKQFSCNAILQLFVRRSASPEQLAREERINLFARGRLEHPYFDLLGEEMAILADEILEE